MKMVNMHYAKTHLSQLAAEMQANGEVVIIAKAGVPIIEMKLYDPKKEPRKLTAPLRGKITIPKNFDTLFQKEIEEMFYGSEE